MIRYFKLSFNNQELEREYQLEMLELAKKGEHQFHLIFVIAIGISMLDQIVKENIIMVVWFASFEIFILSFLCISQRKPQIRNYLQYYYYIFNFTASLAQILYSQCSFFNLQPNDKQIYMDMIQQYCLFAHAKINHLGASLMFMFFIAARVFVQMSDGYSLSSFGYLVYSLFFFIDQYQQAKIRRKLFLKSQRNKQLELLIEEFIDDQVSILEKDEDNITFNTVILNKKLSQIFGSFNQFLKEVKIPQYKSTLLNYLYKSTKQYENLICLYQNKNYQINYQSIMLKKQQIFLKIKLLDQKIIEQDKNQELNQYILNKIHFKPQKFYKGKDIQKQIQFKSFYFLFCSYYQYYQVYLEKINHQFLKDKLKQSKLQLIGNIQIQTFYSDKKLLILLINLIKQIINDKKIIIQHNQEFILIEFNSNSCITDSQIEQINKILFHIGYGKVQRSQLSDQSKISIVLIDKFGFEKFQFQQM